MQEYSKLCAGCTEIERSTPGTLIRPKRKHNEHRANLWAQEDIGVKHAVEVGVTNPNTSNGHMSHQKPRWVDADDFGPVLFKSECAAESPEGLVKHRFLGPSSEYLIQYVHVGWGPRVCIYNTFLVELCC